MARTSAAATRATAENTGPRRKRYLLSMLRRGATEHRQQVPLATGSSVFSGRSRRGGGRPCHTFIQRSRSAAPTGRDSKAQGDALRNTPKNDLSPERARRIGFAPSGLVISNRSQPKALPWAIESCPFRAQECSDRDLCRKKRRPCPPS